MSGDDSYGGLKARVLQVGTMADEQRGPLAQAGAGIDEATNAAMAANQDSENLSEVIATLQQAREYVTQAEGLVGAVQGATEDAAAALS